MSAQPPESGLPGDPPPIDVGELAPTPPDVTPAPATPSLAEGPPVSPPEEMAALMRQVAALEEAVKKGSKKKKKNKGRLGSDRGIETMFRTSYRTHVDLSHLADNKANIMISINGIMISILLASISPKIDANPWLLLPTSVLLVGAVASLIFAILAARPRVTSHVVTLEDVRSDRSNILFFGNFISLREEDYLLGMKELMLDTDRLYSNMIRDIYTLGHVLAKKFQLLRMAYNLFMVALVSGVASFLVVIAQVSFSGGVTP